MGQCRQRAAAAGRRVPRHGAGRGGAEACGPAFRLLHGVVDGSVTAVSVLLGDGRRRGVPTVPISDGRRTYAVATGLAAVRSVPCKERASSVPRSRRCRSVCAGGGRACGSSTSAAPPSGSSRVLASAPAVTPTGPVTTIAGSPGMQVADGPAETLCIAVAGRPFDGFGCGIVPPREPGATYDNFLDPRAFAVVVPAAAVAMRFGTADGKVVRTVATAVGAGYRGATRGGCGSPRRASQAMRSSRASSCSTVPARWCTARPSTPATPRSPCRASARRGASPAAPAARRCGRPTRATGRRRSIVAWR